MEGALRVSVIPLRGLTRGNSLRSFATQKSAAQDEKRFSSKLETRT